MNAIVSTDTAAIGLVLGAAVFNTSPPTAQGLSISALGGSPAGDHQRLGNNDAVTVQFNLDADAFTKTLAVRVNGLVSRNGNQEGFSPISLQVNGGQIVSGFTMPGGGFGPQDAIFPIPAALLKAGPNALQLQVAGNAQTFFWLYGLEIDFVSGPYVGKALAANLRVSPVALSPGLSITTNGGSFAGDHYKYAQNTSFGLQFSLTDLGPAAQVSVALYGLVSRNGNQDGYSPISLIFNGKPILADYTVPGGGFGPQWVEVAVPAELCVSGANTIVMTVSPDATTFFWLYDFAVSKGQFYTPVATADFSVSPPKTNQLTVSQNDGSFAGDHVKIAQNGVVSVTYQAASASAALMIEFDGLVSRNGNQDGNAPVSLSVNGTQIIANYVVPGGGFGYQANDFVVPPQLVKAGANTFSLQVASTGTTYFWLRGMAVRTPT